MTIKQTIQSLFIKSVVTSCCFLAWNLTIANNPIPTQSSTIKADATESSASTLDNDDIEFDPSIEVNDNLSTNHDPYESYNRKMFAFNMAMDSLILKPTTLVYTHLTPSPLRTGIHNFFNNLSEITTIANDLLQGKLAFAVSDSWRLIFNSTLGFGGFIDIASKMGLPQHSEDFGLTLATWGAHRSAYFITPLLGPNTLRDTFAEPFDLAISAWPLLSKSKLYYPLITLWFLDLRAQLLPADDLIQQAFDPYIFVRNAYLQMREKEVEENKLSYAAYKDQVSNPSLNESINDENDWGNESNNSGDDFIVVKADAS